MCAIFRTLSCNFYITFGGVLRIVMHNTLYLSCHDYWSDKSSPKKMVKIRGRLHDKKQSIMHFCPQVGLCKADAPCFSGVRGRLNKHHRKNDISLQVGKMPPILQKKVELTIEFHCYTSQITIFRGLTMLSTTHPPLLPNQ